MPTWRSLRVQETLLQKGFERKNTGDARFFLYVEGKLTSIGTTVSHGRFDITRGRFPFTAIQGQMKLTAGELTNFLDCSMSGDDYVALLRRNGKIE